MALALIFIIVFRFGFHAHYHRHHHHHYPKLVLVGCFISLMCRLVLLSFRFVSAYFVSEDHGVEVQIA